MKRKSGKGFTLLEVTLTVALMGMVSLIIYSIFSMASKPHAIVSNEFTFQANTRLASQKITEIIKKSTAIFVHKKVDPIFAADIFPETKSSVQTVIIDDSFINSSSEKQKLLAAMDKYKGWSFITLNHDGTELREFIYQKDPGATNGFYILRRIIENQKVGIADIQYEITYKKNKPYDQDSLLEYTLVAKPSDPAVKIEPVEVKSEVEALNSLQVIDKGDYTQPGSVIFFRTDDRPVGREAEAAIAMVLDVSGSMAGKMNGNTNGVSQDPSNVNASRIAIMKAKAKELIDNIVSSGDVKMKTEVSLIPFSNRADVLSDWKDVGENQEHLKNLISGLNAEGGTNVGDGIRRAYYQFKKYTDKVSGNENNGKYLILLMDGVPTFGSVHKVGHKEEKRSTHVGPSIMHSGYEYFYDRTSGWFWPEYIYKRFSDIEFVTSDIKINETRVNSPSSRYADGRYAGRGNASEPDLSKGYITEMAKKMQTLKNSNGENNVKVFVIGFSDVAIEKAELEFIKGELAKYTKGVDVYDVNDAEGLENAFISINQIILDDLWHILGPKE